MSDREPDEVRDHYERPELVARYGSDGQLSPAELALVERYIPPRSSVLEVGTGAGRAALELARRGFQVTALDISAPMIDFARSAATRLGLEVAFEVGDARALPHPDDAFDASAFLCNGIGHLDRRSMAQSLAELHRVTRPGGTVIVSFRTPYALNRLLPALVLRSLTRRGASRDDAVSDGTYVHRPSGRVMERLVRDSGIEVVETTSLRAAAERRPARRWELYVGGQFFVVGRSR